MAISKYLSIRAGLLAATVLVTNLAIMQPNAAHAQMVGVSVIMIAPPALPYYAQPPMPEMGYIWTPGYWAYSDAGYYWVPGTWVLPPRVGYLWTPPYWGWNNGGYSFFPGYWGRNVGYYGGVDYGYGYGGRGYDGGRWNGQHFQYNRAANNFGAVRVDNAYQGNLAIINHSNISYAGGNGGLRSRPSAQELAAGHETHVRPTDLQQQHFSAAASNPGNALSHNNGHPAVMATQRPATTGGANHPNPTVGGQARPAGQEARPTPPNAQAPRPPQQMNRPAPQAQQVPQAQALRPPQQLNRPAPQAQQTPQAQAPRPPQRMNRPAPQAQQGQQGGAPAHADGGDKKQ